MSRMTAKFLCCTCLAISVTASTSAAQPSESRAGPARNGATEVQELVRKSGLIADWSQHCDRRAYLHEVFFNHTDGSSYRVLYSVLTGKPAPRFFRITEARSTTDGIEITSVDIGGNHVKEKHTHRVDGISRRVMRAWHSNRATAKEQTIIENGRYGSGKGSEVPPYHKCNVEIDAAIMRFLVAAKESERNPTVVPRERDTRPSFDCTQARTASARLICADDDLATKDAEMAVPFRTHLSKLQGAEREALLLAQRTWLNERNARCGLVGKNNEPIGHLAFAKKCMANAMNARIAELRSERRSPETTQSSATDQQRQQPSTMQQAYTFVEHSTAATNCQIVNDATDRGSDVRWFGECIDGFASGTGIARWYRDGILTYEVEHTKANGLLKEKGQTVPVNDAIDRNISMIIGQCTPLVSFRWVDVKANSNLALYHRVVSWYILNMRAQVFAWEKCPAQSLDNVSISIEVSGKRIIHARSNGNVFGRNQPAKTVWHEFNNFAWEERIRKYDQIYEQGKVAKAAAIERQMRANAGFKKDILGFKVGEPASSISEIVAKSGCRTVAGTGNIRNLECPNGKIQLTLTNHLDPQLISAVSFRFCDLKMGQQVSGEVAKQFGMPTATFQWIGTAGYRLDERTTLSLNAIQMENCTVNGLSGYPYSLVLVDQLVIQQDQQALERKRQSAPTTRF